MSLPVSRGLVVSLYLILLSLLASCILYIQPCVSLVLCELLNVRLSVLPVIVSLFPLVFGLLFVLVFP